MGIKYSLSHFVCLVYLSVNLLKTTLSLPHLLSQFCSEKGKLDKNTKIICSESYSSFVSLLIFMLKWSP